MAAGVHPNTVRLYEAWGYLPPIPRSRSGYRQFTGAHVAQMKLARLALQWPYPGGKEPVAELVRRAAQGDFGRALELAYRYLANVRAEVARAEAAVAFLEEWAAGQVTDRSLTPLPATTVRLVPPPEAGSAEFTARTDASGTFRMPGVPSGRYAVILERDGYVRPPDSVTVPLGQTTEVMLEMNGLPFFEQITLNTTHISRWWPPDDLYRLDVSVTANDPDPFDVADVWLELPALSFADTLEETQTPGVFTTNLRPGDIPISTLHQVLGEPIRLLVRDRAGAQVQSLPQSPVRIIDETPLARSPQGLVSVDPRPLFEWERMTLPFPFTYRVEVVRVDPDIQTAVQSFSDLPSDTTKVQLATPLDTGEYFWTVAIVDAFGNLSRSKEAGFRID